MKCGIEMTTTCYKRSTIRQWHRMIAVTLVMVGHAWGGSLSAKIVDPSGNPVADAAVYALPRAVARGHVRAPKGVAIEQKDREFVPYVTVVQTGTTVSFPNRDPLLHHVYSFSPAKSFEIKLYSGDAPRGIVFDKPGTVTLGCNIHDWMIGYILVVETPFFGKSGVDGKVHISELTAGEYEVVVWHPTQRAVAEPKAVRIDADVGADVMFTLDATPRIKRFKPPLDGVRYK
ncbi:MAG: methylamine utilization protein [Betaproteobacteria bacterium]